MNQAAPASRPKKLRIVLVDDEKYMLQLLETYIQSWFDDVDLLQFQNGDDAWREMSETEPDLLITDWRHPGLDGGELLRKLAGKHVRTPVLMISAHDNDCIQEFLASGMKIVFLQKPFGVAQFWQALDGLIGPCDHPPRFPKYVK